MGTKTHFHIITIFPEIIKFSIKSSIIGKAVNSKIIKVSCYDPKDYLRPGKRVDSKPYGGGPGMVLESIPFLGAYKKALGQKKQAKTIFFARNGKKLNNKLISSYKNTKHIILIAGHYEGIDERVFDATNAEKISIGDYTLTGGELASLIFIDSLSREIEGVLGNPNSREHTRIHSHKVYTRPDSFKWKGKEYNVPKILLEGNHKKIDNWRKKN